MHKRVDFTLQEVVQGIIQIGQSLAGFQFVNDIFPDLAEDLCPKKVLVNRLRQIKI